jgi:hypothetical protein
MTAVRFARTAVFSFSDHDVSLTRCDLWRYPAFLTLKERGRTIDLGLLQHSLFFPLCLELLNSNGFASARRKCENCGLNRKMGRDVGKKTDQVIHWRPRAADRPAMMAFS